MADLSNIRASLEAAERDLRRFESGIDRQDLLARLERDNPLHPSLLVAKGALIVSITSLAATLVWMLLGMAWSHLAAQAPPPLQTTALVSGPIYLAILTGVAALVSTCAESAAVGRGAQAPMTPEELRVYEPLVTEV